MKISSETRRSYLNQRKNKREKRICQGVLVFVAAILLLCLLVAVIGGCSSQRYRKYIVDPDGRVIKVIDIETSCILREFNSEGSELVIRKDLYRLKLNHQSRTSPVKLKATHPTGIGVEIVTE